MSFLEDEQNAKFEGVMSVNMLAFLAYFSRVLYKFNVKFTLISVKNALIPHLNVFCRF